jgi:DNA-binding NtrC family response regulator
MEELRESGQLRDDFFFRLNVVSLTVPPLRERRSDIPLLLNHFVGLYSARNKKEPVTFTPDAMELLQHYTFPGNVRELENIVERLVVMLPGERIHPRHLPDVVSRSSNGNGHKLKCFRTDLSLREAVRDFEVQFIQHVLDEEQGSRTKAAKRLGISRKTVWDKLSETVTKK